jgi:transcription elongation GreA/GreB family factor
MSTIEIAADVLAVHVGSVVSFTDTNAGRDQTFKLVNPDQADPAKGRLSMASPIARALLGRQVGDRVEVRTPKGVRPLMIAAIG